MGYQGEPPSTLEKSYRLFIQELPVTTPGEVEMKFAVRMGIPVFVRPVDEEFAWNVGFTGLVEQGLSIRVNNTGSRFLMVGAMQVAGWNVEGKEVFQSSDQGWYVLAGQGRNFKLPIAKELCNKATTIEVTVTIAKETRNRTLDGIDCEVLESSEPPQSRRLMHRP